MKYVSVGKGGIFAVKAKDDSVWYRTFEQGGKPVGKVLPDNDDHGVLWSKIQVMPQTTKFIDFGNIEY